MNKETHTTSSKQEEESKYFIPDISDLHIGYECEIYAQCTSKMIRKVEWHSVKVSYSPEMSEYVGILQCKKLIKTHHIRVPYLTKEQIQAEGWTEYIIEYKRDINLENMNYVFFNEKLNYMLCWFFNRNQIALLVKDPSKALDTNGNIINYNDTPRYTGECKDINTLRKIIKLLEI
jgi:hypothetical protein